MSLIFWNLLLAHFLGDYLLQPDWMAREKYRLPVLLLHVSIHLVVLLIIAGFNSLVIWPQLLSLAVLHFWIDFGKNLTNKHQPRWIIVPYGIDQLLHYLSIWLIAAWIWNTYGQMGWPLNLSAVVYLTGYLVVTYVWYISERVLAYAQPEYRSEVVRLFWPRMLTRAAFFSLILIGWQVGSAPTLIGLAAFPLPYLTGEYRARTLLTDLSVALLVAVVVLLVT